MDAPVLLIIDMQRDVVEGMVRPGAGAVPKIREVLEACRKNKVPVIHVVRVHRPDGSDVEAFRKKKFAEKPYLLEGSAGAEVVDELAPIPGEYVIRKRRFSAFFGTEMLLLLRSLGARTLVVCGVQTPNCVRATVVDAVEHDFMVVVLRDATKAQTPEVHEANLYDMQNMGVELLDSKDFTSQSR